MACSLPNSCLVVVFQVMTTKTCMLWSVATVSIPLDHVLVTFLYQLSKELVCQKPCKINISIYIINISFASQIPLPYLGKARVSRHQFCRDNLFHARSARPLRGCSVLARHCSCQTLSFARTSAGHFEHFTSLQFLSRKFAHFFIVSTFVA